MRRPAFIFSIFARPFLRTRPPLLMTAALCFALTFAITLPAAFFSLPAFSQPINAADQSGTENDVSHVSHPRPDASANTDDTQIVVDKQNHVVRIFAGGKQVVTIDAVGLHVKGDLDHTGTDTDLGEDEHAK